MVAPGTNHPLHEFPSFSINEEHKDRGVQSRKRIAPTERDNNKRSVHFATQVYVHTIPSLSEADVNEMFYTKKEKKDLRSEIKRIVHQLRNGRLSKEEEAEQKIGLESHINPGTKYQTRRQLIRLVMNHQRWRLHNNGFFDDDFLAKNCRSVSSHSTRMAQERALGICTFPRKDKPFLSAPLNVVMAR
jgi:hypothetical protein